MCQGEEIISARSHITILHKGVMKMSIESFLEISYIFHINNPANGYLFSFFLICYWGWHFSLIIFFFLKYNVYQYKTIFFSIFIILLLLHKINNSNTLNLIQISIVFMDFSFICKNSYIKFVIVYFELNYSFTDSNILYIM